MMAHVSVILGLALLVVSGAIMIWLVSQYEARIALLDAHLRRPCPHCLAVRDTAWEFPR
jgi:hypothetical protein